MKFFFWFFFLCILTCCRPLWFCVWNKVYPVAWFSLRTVRIPVASGLRAKWQAPGCTKFANASKAGSERFCLSGRSGWFKDQAIRACSGERCRHIRRRILHSTHESSARLWRIVVTQLVSCKNMTFINAKSSCWISCYKFAIIAVFRFTGKREIFVPRKSLFLSLSDGTIIDGSRRPSSAIAAKMNLRADIKYIFWNLSLAIVPTLSNRPTFTGGSFCNTVLNYK